MSSTSVGKVSSTSVDKVFSTSVDKVSSTRRVHLPPESRDPVHHGRQEDQDVHPALHKALGFGVWDFGVWGVRIAYFAVIA